MNEQSTLTWSPIETAPWNIVVWVKNDLMEKPILATRGYVVNGAVHEDHSLFTSVFTPDEFHPMPEGSPICPTQWAPAEKKR